MNTHVVTKPLPQGGTVLQIGTEVDASDWKYTRQLEEQRYIKPLQAVTIQPDGRKRMGRKENDGDTGN